MAITCSTKMHTYRTVSQIIDVESTSFPKPHCPPSTVHYKASVQDDILTIKGHAFIRCSAVESVISSEKNLVTAAAKNTNKTQLTRFKLGDERA